MENVENGSWCRYCGAPAPFTMTCRSVQCLSEAVANDESVDFATEVDQAFMTLTGTVGKAALDAAMGKLEHPTGYVLDKTALGVKGFVESSRLDTPPA